MNWFVLILTYIRYLRNYGPPKAGYGRLSFWDVTFGCDLRRAKNHLPFPRLTDNNYLS